MPHTSRSLLLLLLLAGCGTPSRESDTAAKPWSRRSWRSPDRPVVSVEGETSRLRAWVRDDSAEVEAEQVSVSLAEPVPIETPVLEEEPPEPETPAPADPAQLVDLRASIVLMWYFQRDEDPSSLDRSELERAFGQYDWNKDGVVNELEFDATTGSSAHYGREPQGEALEPMGDVRPLDALLAAVDSDADGTFSLSELLAFHEQRFAPEPH